MKKRNVLLLLLSACLLSAALSACGEEGKPAGSTDTEETKAPENDDSEMSFIERLTYDRSQISDNLPDTDLGGAKFRIGYLNIDMYVGDWVAEKENADTLNDAVYKRNLAVEERFHVTLDTLACDKNDYVAFITNRIVSGDPGFDMLSAHPGYFGSLIAQGMFLPLNDLEYFDFSKPWWISETMDAVSYLGNRFAAFGFGNTASMINDVTVVFFNKEIAQDLDLGDFYTVVREGKWTVDYAEEAAKLACADLDNDGFYSVDSNDRLGVHVSGFNDRYRLPWFFGEVFMINDGADLPTLNLDSPRLEQVLQRGKDFLSVPGFVAEESYDDRFATGNVLFEIAHINSCGAYRDADFDFGILPTFKYDEEQEYYLTTIGGCPQMIPTTNADPDTASLLMEALNAESYKKVVPAFYETVLKDKCTRDVDSAEMLDLTLSHSIYDPANLYCANLIYIFSDYCTATNGYGSFIEEKKSKFEQKLKDILKSFDDLDF